MGGTKISNLNETPTFLALLDFLLQNLNGHNTKINLFM